MNLIDADALRERLEPFMSPGRHPQLREGFRIALSFLDSAPAITCATCNARESEAHHCWLWNIETRDSHGCGVWKARP